MTRLNVNDARCEALFASGLQRSDAPTPEALAEVISRTVRQFGIAAASAGWPRSSATTPRPPRAGCAGSGSSSPEHTPQRPRDPRGTAVGRPPPAPARRRRGPRPLAQRAA